MDKNKVIIIALVVIIIALLVGIFSAMPNVNNQDTNLTFKCKSTITEGDSIKVQLTDINGTAIANQTINVTVTDKDKFSDYHSVVTNDKGVGKVKIDKSPGKYEITISYGGNDKYNGCNATKKVTIEEEVVEEEVVESSSSNNDNAIYYDSEINVYYDSNGVIVDPDGHHGQSVGSTYSAVKEFYESGRGME